MALMPATSTRPRPVDLWLCGHHWRASRQALDAAGAVVRMVSPSSVQLEADRETAAV
jgi:hypothetical protein